MKRILLCMVVVLLATGCAPKQETHKIIIETDIPLHQNTKKPIETEILIDSQLISDLLEQLRSCKGIWDAEHGKEAKRFQDIVTITMTEGEAKHNGYPMTMRSIGTNKKGDCQFKGNTIVCPEAFRHYKNVTFLWDYGYIQVSATPVGGAPPLVL